MICLALQKFCFPSKSFGIYRVFSNVYFVNNSVSSFAQCDVSPFSFLDFYVTEMFSFFRKSQDTKKVLVTEKEADGFVVLGK